MNSSLKMAVVGLCGLAVAVGGCQKYQNYPAVPTARGMAEDPNNPATESAIVAAVQYVANRYPPGGPRYEALSAQEAGSLKADYPFALSVPPGMRKSFYERIPGKIGPEVVPLTPEVVEQGRLPILFVTRVQLRFQQGIVDVLRPMPELGKGPDGRAVYQKVTVRLKGGFEPWHAIHGRAWEPGADEAPEYYFLPDIERVDQYEYSQMDAQGQEAFDRALGDKPRPFVDSSGQRAKPKAVPRDTEKPHMQPDPSEPDEIE